MADRNIICLPMEHQELDLKELVEWRAYIACQIGIWKCWFVWREEKQRTWRKTLGAGTRSNIKLNPHMALGWLGYFLELYIN